MIVKHNDDPMKVAVVAEPCVSDEEYVVIAPSLLVGTRLPKREWSPMKEESLWP